MDPETGTLLRPRGRAPIGVVDWDESKGAWRLTATSVETNPRGETVQ
jgi:hypothetical protein